MYVDEHWDLHRRVPGNSLQVLDKVQGNSILVLDKVQGHCILVLDKVQGKSLQVLDKVQGNNIQVLDKVQGNSIQVLNKVQGNSIQYFFFKKLYSIFIFFSAMCFGMWQMVQIFTEALLQRFQKIPLQVQHFLALEVPWSMIFIKEEKCFKFYFLFKP